LPTCPSIKTEETLIHEHVGRILTWWVSHLGTDALAGMAVVFPVVMLMQMMSQGAMGGGISSSIARALGAGRQEEAVRSSCTRSSSTQRSGVLPCDRTHLWPAILSRAG
jgi:Na+-driven multidrug efflux pump